MSTYEVRQIPTTRTVLDGTEWFEGQTVDGGVGSSFKAQASALALIGVLRVDYDTDYAIPSGEMNRLHTNIGATGPIVLDLSPALIGIGGVFYSTGDYPMYLDPNGADVIGEGGAGKMLVILDQGFVTLDCINSGEFSPHDDSATYLIED